MLRRTSTRIVSGRIIVYPKLPSRQITKLYNTPKTISNARDEMPINEVYVLQPSQDLNWPREFPSHLLVLDQETHGAPEGSENVNQDRDKVNAKQIQMEEQGLNKIERQLDPEVRNAVNTFWAALVRNEIEGIVNAYMDLKRLSALQQLQSSDIVKTVQILSEFLSRAPTEPSTAIRHDAEDMAAFFASKGAPEPLNSAMAYHMKHGNCDRILDLWSQYSPRWKAPLNQSVPRDATVPLENDDRLLHVIAAASIKDDYETAVMAMYTTGYRFSSWRLEAYISNYLVEQPSNIRQRFRDFVQDATLSRDLRRDALIFNQVNEIRRFKDWVGLMSLYSSIKDGLDRRIFRLPTDPIRPPSGHNADSRPIIKPRIWTLFIWAAVEHTRIELAQKMMEDMTRFGIKPTIGEWNYLLYAYSKRGDIESMTNLIKKIRQDGIEPNLRSFSVILAALYDRRRLEQAGDVLKTVQSYKVPPEEIDTANTAADIRIAYNVAINGLLRNMRTPEANILLQKMQTDGPKPDIVTFNTFINRYTHMKDRAGVAATLRSMDEAGIRPDIYTFTILYVGASRNKNEKLKQDILRQMQTTGVQANSVFLSAVINAVLGSKSKDRMQTAFEILSKMEKNSNTTAQPNEVTYCNIISGIGSLVQDGELTIDEGLKTGKMIYERMLRKGFRPNRVAYHLMMNFHLRHPDPESKRVALSYFSELKKANLLTGDSWYILLQGLWERKDFDLAKQMVHDLRMSPWEPSPSLQLLADRIMGR